MDIFLYVVIGVLLVIVLVLLFRPRRVEMPAIDELEEKLRFALASAASVKEIQDTLEDLPHDVLESITRSLGQRTGKLDRVRPQPHASCRCFADRRERVAYLCLVVSAAAAE